jgi:hypothetical protein
MLEVRYYEMTPRLLYGSNLAANWGYLYKEFGEKERVTIYSIDANANLAEAVFAYDYPGKYTVPGKITDTSTCNCQPALQGVRMPVRPHLGTAGVAPDVKGRVSSIPPGAHGGNIDNWRIGAGAVMYYPIAVDGALFSVGDPHVSQGDGELSGTAIEASLDVPFAERALRCVALGRRNWTFCGSDRGGERAAAIYSLIATAKLNDIDPEAWLADVLRRINDHPASKLDELLPWRWQRHTAADAAAA